jgi:hypothetical protein
VRAVPTGSLPAVTATLDRATAAPSVTPLPAVPGLTAAEVAGLATLAQVDDYPLYVMHHYSSGAAARLPRASLPAWGCSLFAALGDEAAPLYGRNFDWSYSPALLLIHHPDDGYASAAMVDLAYFIDRELVSDLVSLPLAERAPLLDMVAVPFDGMNEHGLAVGMAAVPASELPQKPGRPTIGSLGIIREMLDHARDVEEALALMAGYNVAMEGGPAVHYLIADAAGSAVLVEFYRGEVVFVPNTAPWHAATNFYRASAGMDASGRCARYDEITTTLADRAGTLAPGVAMDLLSRVAQSSTQWSVVYHLRDGMIDVVMGRDYDQVHTLDVAFASD